MRKSLVKAAVAAGVSAKNKKNVHVVQESPPTTTSTTSATTTTEKQSKNRVEKRPSQNNFKKPFSSVAIENNKKNKVDVEIIDLEVEVPAPPIAVNKSVSLSRKREKVQQVNKQLPLPSPSSTPLSEDQKILQTLENFYKNHGLSLDEVYLALRSDSFNTSSEEIYWETSTIPLPSGYSREQVANILQPMQNKQNKGNYLSPMIMAIEQNKRVNSNKSKNRAKLRQELLEKKKRTSGSQESSSSSSSDKKNAQKAEAFFNDEEFPNDDDLNDSQILLATQQVEELYQNKEIHSNKTPRLDVQSVVKLPTPQPSSSSQRTTPVSSRNLRSSSTRKPSAVSIRSNQSLFEDSNSNSSTPAKSNSSQFRTPRAAAFQKPSNSNKLPLPTKTLFKSSTPIRPTTKTDESPTNMFNGDEDEEMDKILSQMPIPSAHLPTSTTVAVEAVTSTSTSHGHGHGSHSLNISTSSNKNISFNERTTEIISDDDSFFQNDMLDEIDRMEENALKNNNVLKSINKVTNHHKLLKK